MRKLFFLILVTICLFSCNNNVLSEKFQFLRDYNRLSNSIVNPLLTSTHAKEVADDEIKIVFNFRVREDSLKQELLKVSAPDLVRDMLLSNKRSKFLLDKGIKFKIEICNENSVHLDSFYLDKSTIGIKSSSPKDEGLQTVLQTLNSKLPIEDKSTGIKFTQIQLSDNELIYLYEVPEDLVILLQLEGVEEELIQEIVSNVELKYILRQAPNYRIDRVKCIYRDAKQNIIKEIVVDSKEFNTVPVR